MTRNSVKPLLALSLFWPCLSWAGDFEAGEQVGRVVGYVLAGLIVVYALFIARWSDEDDQGGFLFRLGVILFPLVFVWGTLRDGFKNTARVLAFAYMLVVLAGIVAGVRGGLGHPADSTIMSAFRGSFVPGCEKSATAALPPGSGDDRQESIHALCECIADDFIASHGVKDVERIYEETVLKRQFPDEYKNALMESSKKCQGSVASQAPAPPPRPMWDWEVKSPDGRAVLAQKDGGATCSLSCAVDAKEVWRADRACEDRAANSHFVANDCERWAVFFASPPPAASLRYTRFISVFDRASPAWEVMGGGLVHGDPPSGVQHLIAGMGANSGGPPGYSSDGRRIEFTTVQNVSQSIPLFKDAPAATLSGSKHHR